VLKLALVATLAFLLGFAALRHHRAEAAENRLAAIASEIAGRDVNVRCQGAVAAAFDIGAEAGSVRFDAAGRPSDTADLKRGTCSALARFPRERLRPEFACLPRGLACPDDVIRSAWSVQALAHEAWHLAGELDEARTQCFGLQSTAYVAERLGADPTQAQALAAYVYVRLYPRMPADYLSGHCRDGGALDLHPETSVWP
jgi:hypothetical protein